MSTPFLFYHLNSVFTFYWVVSFVGQIILYVFRGLLPFTRHSVSEVPPGWCIFSVQEYSFNEYITVYLSVL